MTEVKIYITMQFSGNFAYGTGIYGYVLEAVKDGKPDPNTREYYRKWKGVSQNKTALYAITEALGHMKTKTRITIYINNNYAVAQWQKKVNKKWTKEDFLDKANGPAWLCLLDAAEGQEVTIKYSGHTEYTSHLMTVMRTEQEKIELSTQSCTGATE